MPILRSRLQNSLPVSRTALVSSLSAVIGVGLLSGLMAWAQQRPASAPAGTTQKTSVAADAASKQALVDQYCVMCHSESLKTAGVVLEGLRLDHVGDNTSTWERVLRKVGSGQMPPEGLPRPETANQATAVDRRNGGRRPIGAGLGLLFLVWWVAKSFWLLAVFAVCFGTLYGGYVALAPTLCMELFGPKSLSAILGTLYTAAGLATLIGPTFAGASFDAFGSYDVSILGCAALCFAGAGLATSLRRQFRAPA